MRRSKRGQGGRNKGTHNNQGRRARSARDRGAPIITDEGGPGGRCPTRKVGYASKADAKLAAKRQPDRRLSPFDCEHCPSWHLGTMPTPVRHGESPTRPVQRPMPGRRR